VFIPEKDDIVMVDFEYGDPNRPYVSGSIFSEKVSKGGDDKNKIKSITTRSGSTITFDDEKGSILIKDKYGSDSVIKLDGNKNITIDADTSLTINIGKGASVLKMDNEGNITIDGAVIRINASKNILANSEEKMMLWGHKTVNMISEKINVSASEETTLQGGGGQIVEKGGMVDIN
jgi:uncharacterized protein involved in type VI secretion and phage assembly